jgi:uncharacterized cupin superfamily protein
VLIAIDPSKLTEADFVPSQALSPDWLISGAIDEHLKMLYTAPDEKFMVLVWENRCSIETRLPDYPVDEFLTIISGNVEIENEEGRKASYGAGDSVFIEKGTTCIWRQNGPLRKYVIWNIR